MIRRFNESVSDINELSEIFKEVAEDCIFMEFEVDPTISSGPISIDKSNNSDIYLMSNIDIDDKNWAFFFTMPDNKDRKFFVLNMICKLFKIKTGIDIYYQQKKSESYGSRRLKVIFSKKEWIDMLLNIQDFEQSIDWTEIISDKYKQSVNIIDVFKLNGSLNNDISYIFMISDTIGIKLLIKRSEFSNQMQLLNIKDDKLEYLCYWKPVVLTKGKSYDEPDFRLLDDRNKAGRNVEEIERVTKASNELNISQKVFQIGISNGDIEENINEFKIFINEKVLPLLEDKTSIIYGKFYDQIEKLNKQDNIFIETEILNTYKVVDIYSVILCETTIGDRDFIFKMMLDITRSMVNIYNNTDNNSDGQLLTRIEVDELADTLFLLFTDNKFTPTE